MKRLTVVLFALCVIVFITACGGSSGSSSEGSTTEAASAEEQGEATSEEEGETADASEESDGGSESAMAAAEAALKKYETPVSVLAPPEPLKTKAPPGKTIAFLQNQAVPAFVQQGEEMEAAAKLLGWTVKRLNYDGSTAAAQNAWTQALQLNVDGIVGDSLPPEEFSAQFAASKEAGVPIVTLAASHKAGEPLEFPNLGGVGGWPSILQITEAWAALMAVETEGKGDIGFVTTESIPVFKTAGDALEEALEKFCPECTLEVINNQIEDIGTATPGRVVSTLQAHPDIHYLGYINAAYQAGVNAAIVAAGLQDQVSYTVLNGEEADIKRIKEGTAPPLTASVGTDVAAYGWWAIDKLARYYTKTPIIDETTLKPGSFVPIFVTNENTLGIVEESESLIGIPHSEFEKQFAKTWLVG